MAKAPVTDYSAIIDALRRHGSVYYPQAAMPGEFTVWRRRLRQVTHLAGFRMSVTRGTDYVLIENRDYEVSKDDNLATTNVIEAHIRGQDLSFDDAVRAWRRQRRCRRPGSVFLRKAWSFLTPVRPGDEITAEVEVLERHATKPVVRVRTTVTNSDGGVLDGDAHVYRVPVERSPATANRGR